MDSKNHFAKLSREFLAQHQVYRYRMKKVADMNDDELISCCHFFCEENHLTAEWKAFRKNAEANCRYCSYLKEYIEDGLCYDLQMVAGNCIKPSALPDLKIDAEKCKLCCSECRYSL